MPVEDPWSRWAGVPLAERSRQRRQLILDAAFSIVAEGGLDEVTIRAVSRHSGVHRRYFAESFDSREALLIAMFDAAVADMTHAGIEKLRHDPAGNTEQNLRTVIRSSLSFLIKNPAHGQVIFAALEEPSLRDRWREAIAAFRLLISPPAPDKAQVPLRDTIVAALIEGAVVEFGKRWSAGELGDDVETATDVSAVAVLNLMALNRSIVGADERAAALWRTVGPQ
ncbi:MULTISPECIES: TetR/AcrR family transcriptional regulator [unclassified Mycobacterium]|uniref:TetR/AcrR family transcriptional regulator n=1 Tax=unclassified Mycobacterium TaxID=2642494 RepID=UPI0008998B2B|nr:MULTISPECIES: TetR/AcrR family transcriptional regulator [unclassified Mycobacterium]SEA30822.1 DNA-binding transcriptional regulator, AcrR family [Mycobacterium sp. 283mftsu]